jgi:hypothetical protein
LRIVGTYKQELLMTISRRALDWFASLLQAVLVVALVPAALALADCPSDACDKCTSCGLQTVDWTAIYLGDFATGCALANPYERCACASNREETSAMAGVWCPGPSVLAHDPFEILPASANWGLLINGAKVSLSIDPLPWCDAGSLDCPCYGTTDRDQFNTHRGESSANEAVGTDEDSDECPLQLKPGEAAQEILDVARRLGPGPLHGTIFDDEPATALVRIPGTDRCFRAQRNSESMARAIRSLEARDRQQRYEGPNIEAAFEDSAEQEPQRAAEIVPGIAPFEQTIPQGETLQGTAEQIDALRQAGRMLEKAANLLEEQALYERADELRGQAQQLREDAREAKAHFLDPYQSKWDPRKPIILGGIIVNR